MHENQDNHRLAVYDRCVPFHHTDRTLHRHSNFDQPSQWHDRNTSASNTIGWVPRGLWRDSTFVYSASSSASTCSACHSPNFTPSNLGLAPTPSSGGGASQVRATGRPGGLYSLVLLQSEQFMRPLAPELRSLYPTFLIEYRRAARWHDGRRVRQGVDEVGTC